MSSQRSYLIHCVVELDNSPGYVLREPVGVEAVCYRDLVAFATEIDAEVESIEGADEGQSTALLTLHQKRNRALFQRHTLLPLRFGSVAPSREVMEDFLAASYLHLKEALSSVRGRAEFVVKIRWELPAVLRELLGEEGGELLDASTLVDEEDRSERGRFLFEVAQRKRVALVDAAHQRLCAVALDSSEEKRTDDSVIMNRSYLVERAAEDALDSAMQQLGAESASYLTYQYIGPMPPYSFVPLEFSKGNFELVDQARRTLSLPEHARLSEVKAAYRRLSLRYHPDRNAGDPAAEQRFRELARAYETLRAYCRGRDGADPTWQNADHLFTEEADYLFTEEEVNKVLLVRTGR